MKPAESKHSVLFLLAHLKDLEASDVQDAQEGRRLSLALVQGLVHPGQDPTEKTVVHGLRQGLNGKISLDEKNSSQRGSGTDGRAGFLGSLGLVTCCLVCAFCTTSLPTLIRGVRMARVKSVTLMPCR